MVGVLVWFEDDILIDDIIGERYGFEYVNEWFLCHLLYLLSAQVLVRYVLVDGLKQLRVIAVQIFLKLIYVWVGRCT